MRVRAIACVLGAAFMPWTDARSELAPPELRVCADPAALPFSNEEGEGFENHLAELVARDTGARVTYAWWAQRRGFLRNTLKAGACDVVMGVPRDMDAVRTTRAYYRSTFAFVTRADRGLDVRSLDDPRLKTLRIGVPIVGDDYENPPPVRALARRGIIDNVRGFPMAVDRHRALPAFADALASGEIDVAIAWGPVAGWAMKKSATPLALTTLPERDDDGTPFAFDIAMGVRRREDLLAKKLDDVLARHQTEIARLLDDAGVPRLP